MSNENEIEIPVEAEPRFKFSKKLDEDTNIFTFNYLPHVGLLSPNPKGLLIPGIVFQLFNPSSLEAINMVKVGDMIQVSCDTEHEIYKAWNPPSEFSVEAGYTKMFIVSYVDSSAMGFPVIVSDEGL